MFANSRFSPSLILQAGLGQYRTRCIGIPRLPSQMHITRLASTQMLRSILEPSIVNADTASQIRVPRIVYCTSYKGDKTAKLVYQAIKAGYRGIKTGAEPLKYEEKLVGDGIRMAIEREIVERGELYV